MNCTYCGKEIPTRKTSRNTYAILDWISASASGNFCSEAHALEATIEFNFSTEALKGGIN